MDDYGILLRYCQLKNERNLLLRRLGGGAEKHLVTRQRNGLPRYFLRLRSGNTVREEVIDLATYNKLQEEIQISQEIQQKIKILNREIGKIELLIPKCKENIINLFQQLKQIDPAPKFQTKHMPEFLTYKTLRGDLVRSKSESFAANAMYINNIHYEYEFILPGLSKIPDFYIEKNIRGYPIIWEHFGKMDDPSYVQAFLTKLETYKRFGFTPGHNLIMSFEYYDAENKSNLIPFDSYKAEQIVTEWFRPEGIINKL